MATIGHERSGQEGIFNIQKTEIEVAITMSNSSHRPDRQSLAKGADDIKQSGSVVSMETIQLKETLNQAFHALHTKSICRTNQEVFDRLWDLKEAAILEGKKSVELPSQWLSEFEQVFDRKTLDQLH